MDSAAPDRLRVIRSRIDAIDEEVHRLLIQRSGVIDELIRVKGTSKPGAAFRPDREADMMRRMVVRHSGNLPLVTVEHIWREIITTFTAMQAPFRITVARCSDELAMRDLVRFYFGFSVPVSAGGSTSEALARVAGAGNELAIISSEERGGWWAPLGEPAGPKIFARLPFIETQERMATPSAYVVGPPLQDPSAPDVQLLGVRGSTGFSDWLPEVGGRVVGQDRDEWLLELPIAVTPDDLAGRFRLPRADIRPCGGFAQPIRTVADQKL